MTSDLLLDSPHPNYLVASAFYEAYPDGNIILRPEAVDGLAESFTVIHVGHVDDGVQYLVGLYGEHDLENPPLNPMNMEPLVLGLILVNGQLTVTDALPIEAGTDTIATANVLMVVQYGSALTTEQQSADPTNEYWTVTLEEFPEPVTCCRVATLVHDNDMYYCYVGESANKDGGVTEYFLLIVQVIGDEFFSLDVDDQELWSTLTRTLLQGCGIEPEEDDEEVTETGDDSEPDFS
jgi:hypothetical protein